MARLVPARRTLLAIGGSVVGLALSSGAPAEVTRCQFAGGVGLALLCGGPAEATGWQVASGVTMSLFAGGGFAALTLVTARPIPGQHVVTSVGLLLGGVLLLPFALIDGMAVPVTGDVLALIAYLGV